MNNRSVSRPLAEALRKLLADPSATEQAALALRIFDANHPIKAKTPMQYHAEEHPHWCIEGEPFANVQQVYHRAKRLGYNGRVSVITDRLKKWDTWDKIAAPVSERHRLARMGVKP